MAELNNDQNKINDNSKQMLENWEALDKLLSSITSKIGALDKVLSHSTNELHEQSNLSNALVSAMEKQTKEQEKRAKKEADEQKKIARFRKSATADLQKIELDHQRKLDKAKRPLTIETAAADKLYKKRAEQELKLTELRKKAEAEIEAAIVKRDAAALERAKANLEIVNKQEISDTTTNASNNAVGNLVDSAISGASGLADDAVKAATHVYEEYAANISGRLMGTGMDFNGLMSDIQHKTSTSATVNTEDMVFNLNKLVEAGIADNLELRAFLATMTESVAQTFSVFDGNLIRLIKLQQKDSTAAYMGMEVALTDLFNETFKDTTYLSKLSDNISGAIVDANAMLSAEQGLAFQYTVQKWLGALSEAGASDDFVSTIASGINMLSTGDVKGLSGNDQLQSLLAMSASRSGGRSYSDLLLRGMDAGSTNELMKSMFDYLNEVVSGTQGNNVLQRAYGDVFNFNTSDLKAISNLGATSTSIYNSNLGYGQAVNTLDSRLSTVGERMPLAAKIDNVLDNMLFSIGSNISEGVVGYTLYRVSEAMDKYMGGINIEAAPFGIGISAKLSDLLKMGVVVGSGIQDLIDGTFVDSIQSNIGGLTTSDWVGGFNTTSKIGVSGSGVAVGSMDTETASTSAFDNSKDQGKKITGTEENEEIKIEDLYDELVAIRYDIENVNAANPVVVSDVRTFDLITKIDELSKTLMTNTYDVNIKSINRDVEVGTRVDNLGDKTRDYLIGTLAENIAKRLINVVYKGEALSDTSNIDTDTTITALIELMSNMSNRSGESMDVNLASTDLTVKDMLVRRV